MDGMAFFFCFFWGGSLNDVSCMRVRVAGGGRRSGCARRILLDACVLRQHET